MKYLKRFENKEDKEKKYYWKVSTEPEMYKKSLKYLNVYFNDFLYVCKLQNEGDYVFIINNISDKSNDFYWLPLSEEDWLIDHGYKYMFEVNDSIFNVEKYNL